MRVESLIDLHNNPAVNHIVEFAEIAGTLASDVGPLAHCYQNLVRVAPRRHDRGKRYLHGRTGITSSGASSKRREEHLAVALYNASRDGVAFELPDKRPLEIIDYQVPLKARRAWLGTEEEYVAARRHVRRLAGAWARAFRYVPITVR